MNRTLRTVAALAALAGFTALSAGSLAGSSCAPQGVGDGVQEHAMHMPMPAPAESAPEPAGDCSGAMLHGTCAVAATLPSPEAVGMVPDPGHEAIMAVPADLVPQLFIRTPFHPPRA